MHSVTADFGSEWAGLVNGASGTGDKTGPHAGPWVLADLEDGLFAGNMEDPATGNLGYSSANHPIKSDFVTAMLKGGPGLWA